MPDRSHLKPPPFAAHALMRATSALVPKLGLPTATGYRASTPPLLTMLLMNRLDYPASAAPLKCPRPMNDNGRRRGCSAFKAPVAP